MSIAKERNSTYYYFTKQAIKRQAKHLLDKCLDHRIRKINDLHIFRWSDYYEIVNEKSLTISCFDTLEQATNHCLDYYISSKKITQSELF